VLAHGDRDSDQALPLPGTKATLASRIASPAPLGRELPPRRMPRQSRYGAR
jgi:hypothetical protein